MKKVILLSVFSVVAMASMLYGATGAIDDKPVTVITTFDAKGISSDDIELLMNMFTTAFTNLDVARVVDRGSFDKIRDELSFQSSDWSDSNKVVELGKALNATRGVVGQLMKRGGKFFLTVKILDVNTITIIASHLDRVTNIDDFFEVIPKFCNKLISKISDGVHISNDTKY